jgi:hypothetical protein
MKKDDGSQAFQAPIFAAKSVGTERSSSVVQRTTYTGIRRGFVFRSPSGALRVGVSVWLLTSACSLGGPVVVGTLPADSGKSGDDADPAATPPDSGGGGSGDAAAVEAWPAAGAGPAHMEAGSAAPLPGGDRLEIESGTRATFCAGLGPAARVVAVETNTPTECRAQLARRLFSHALCTCESVSLAGDLFTIDSFDARLGPYAQGSGGASVGINRDLLGTAADTRILGSLQQHGERLVATAGARLRIEEDLSTTAVLETTGASVEVARDARLSASQNPASAKALRVGRDLLQLPGSMSASGAIVAGATRREEFQIARPCDCGDDTPLDVSQLVAQAQQTSDNDVVGLRPDVLTGTLSALPVELPCGRFVLAEASPLGNLALSVPGRSALFVAGNFMITGNVLLDLGSGGELDVFVAGDLNISTLGLAQLGSADRPWALRFYVAGSAPIRILGLGVLAAQIYAPRASVEVGANTALYGSVFAASFSGRDAAIHYDRSIAAWGESCQAP